MSLATALTYWVIVLLWLTVLATVAGFYIRNPRTFGTTRLLLAVLAIDTLRNIVENSYFGAYFGGLYGLFPGSFVAVLGHPLLLILPKLLNIVAGVFVLLILLLRWLPATVHERKSSDETAEDLREQATHDGLTGLFNRRHFLALAEAEWDRARRYGRPLSLLMCDIDLFKSINDRFGHDAGDRVIVAIAQACRDHTRGADIVARVGGEEFVVLLPETNADDAQVLAERLRQAVGVLRLSHPEADLAATISIGVADESGAKDVAEMMKRADRALYAAKRDGRNRVCAFDATNSTAGDVAA
jgi:diguanylate cyclase (GGDEF)-like protein